MAGKLPHDACVEDAFVADACAVDACAAEEEQQGVPAGWVPPVRSVVCESIDSVGSFVQSKFLVVFSGDKRAAANPPLRHQR